MRKRFINLFFTALAALSLSIPAVFAQDEPSVDDLLADTATRLDETESMSFTMEIEGTTYVDAAKTIQLKSAEGIMQRPDRVDVTFTALVLGRQQISIRMKSIGDESWITDLVTGQWVPSPAEFGYNPSILYDDVHGLGPVIGRMDEPELVGSEEIDGREAWHIQATADGEIISIMTSGAMRGSKHELDIWVDKETNDILRIRISEPTGEDLEDPAKLTLTLADHDEEVTIEPPDAD